MNILVNTSLSEAERELLLAAAGSDNLTFARPHAFDPAQKLAFMEAQVVFGACPPEWLNQTHNLRWLQLHSVGFGEYTGLDWARLSRHIQCTNLSGFFADPVAQSVLAALLVLYRSFDRLIPLQAERQWQQLALRPHLKLLDASTTVLLVGYGSIAQRLHELLAPFGCQIVSFARNNPQAILHTLEELDNYLPQAEIVCSSLPDTAQTRGLFSRVRLNSFKLRAVFVNVGRGSAVDETALVEMLESRHLAGAVLDVTQQEPLPPDNPLWSCPNLILTQHTAGGWEAENSGRVAFFLENLARFRAGELLKNMIDWDKGY